jgi:hypothetical protein
VAFLVIFGSVDSYAIQDLPDDARRIVFAMAADEALALAKVELGPDQHVIVVMLADGGFGKET